MSDSSARVNSEMAFRFCFFGLLHSFQGFCKRELLVGFEEEAARFCPVSIICLSIVLWDDREN